MVVKRTLPSAIDDGRLDWVLDLLSESRKLSAGRGEIRLDWSRVAELSPAGLAILCCLFDSFVEQKNRVKNVFISKKFKSIPVVEHLIGTKTFSRLPSPDIQDYETKQVILRGRTSLDILFPERFREKFSSLLHSDISYDCLLVLNELMQNTVDHSTAERYYLYAGPWKGEFHVGVLDMGATIPAKMEQKYTCANDLAYLELALKEGVGTRRQRPGGIGLSYFFTYLKKHAGKLTIISRSAQIRRYFNTRRSQKNMLKHSLMGTWCFARFSPPHQNPEFRVLVWG